MPKKAHFGRQDGAQRTNNLRSLGAPWIVLGYLGPSCGYLVASVGIPWISLGYLGPSCGYLFFNQYLLLLTITTYCRLLLLLLEMGLTFACPWIILGYLGPYVRLCSAFRSAFLGSSWAILGPSCGYEGDT